MTFGKPIIFLILSISLALSDEFGPIGAGRPGMANPTTSVPVGLYQFEMGLNSDMNDMFSYPLFFRTGIFSKTEIQVGYSDNISIGILYGSFNIAESLEQSIIFSTSLSESNNEISAIDLYLPFSLSTSFPIWGQIAGSFPFQEAESTSFSYALGTGNTFTDKINWFIEFYGDVTINEQGIDTGGTYLLNQTMQLDFSFGTSLTNTESKFVELGFSFRIPK